MNEQVTSEQIRATRVWQILEAAATKSLEEWPHLDLLMSCRELLLCDGRRDVWELGLEGALIYAALSQVGSAAEPVTRIQEVITPTVDRLLTITVEVLNLDHVCLEEHSLGREVCHEDLPEIRQLLGKAALGLDAWLEAAKKQPPAFPNRCPYCGSLEVSSMPESDGEQNWQLYTCAECGSHWSIPYTKQEVTA